MQTGELIEDGDDTILFGGQCSVAIPQGVGRFQVVSNCGAWSGELVIVLRGGRRFLTYMKMTQPVSVAMRAAKSD